MKSKWRQKRPIKIGSKLNQLFMAVINTRSEKSDLIVLSRFCTVPKEYQNQVTGSFLTNSFIYCLHSSRGKISWNNTTTSFVLRTCPKFPFYMPPCSQKVLLALAYFHCEDQSQFWVIDMGGTRPETKFMKSCHTVNLAFFHVHKCD